MSASDHFVIKKAYQLSAVNKAGQRVYYDTDAHSGGYPYWSTWYNNVTFDSLEKIPNFKSLDYMLREVARIEVLEVTIQARIVESTELISKARARAMAEIAKIEQDLARKIAQLEGTK